VHGADFSWKIREWLRKSLIWNLEVHWQNYSQDPTRNIRIHLTVSYPISVTSVLILYLYSQVEIQLFRLHFFRENVFIPHRFYSWQISCHLRHFLSFWTFLCSLLYLTTRLKVPLSERTSTEGVSRRWSPKFCSNSSGWRNMKYFSQKDIAWYMHEMLNPFIKDYFIGLNQIYLSD
jgi:hypothetical protein